MKIYRDVSVVDESLCRIRWLFSEFSHIVVSFSGGKDSTIIYNLTLQVARELNRKFYVLFVDQEAEYQETIRVVEQVMSNDSVIPLWVQVPFRLFNTNSHTEPWLHCWEPGAEWMRDKHPVAIHTNIYGVDRFKKLFDAVVIKEVGGDTAVLSGLRTDESVSRLSGLVGQVTYKDVTWGAIVSKKLKLYRFAPIYDWSFNDVWSVINANDWDYNKVYDWMYGLGVSSTKMRVSSLCHESTSDSLFLLQEMEPDTWDKLVRRLPGIHSSGGNKFAVKCPDGYPYMFSGWLEYRDYLAENLLVPEVHKKFKEKFGRYDAMWGDDPSYFLVCINCILSNDYYFTKLMAYVVRKTNEVRIGR